MSQKRCKNCGAEITGKFCANCGQRSEIHDFTFSHIFHEVMHAFTHADKNFFVMVKGMIINPAKIAWEYIIEGKRQRYYNIFAFFLIITAVNAFVEISLLNLKENIFHDNNEYAMLFNAYNKLMLLAIVPAVGFAVFGLYHCKSKRRYSEYTVFAMVLVSMKTTIDLLVNSVNFLLVHFFKVYRGLDDSIIYVLVITALIAMANYRFHKHFGDRSVVKAILSGVLFNIIIGALAMFVVWAFLRHFEGLGVFTIYGIRIGGK